MNSVDKDVQELYELGDELFKHPELGYKEFTNKRILTEYFSKYGLKVEDLGFETAFKVSIGKGHPHIGLIAEIITCMAERNLWVVTVGKVDVR